MPRVLVVVEGVNDISFLRHASRILHAADSTLPDLAASETESRLLFVPTGGALNVWASRLAPLAIP